MQVPDYMQRGLLEESLLLLLEANINQAAAAGAQPAADLMGRLMTQIRMEIDKAVEPELRLLRELLRIETPEARRELLRQKISPKDATTPSILIAGARETKGPKKDVGPEVKVRKFAQQLVKLKAQFGNMEEEMSLGLMDKLDIIANEAEAVAREFGVGADMSPQELQDLMWQKSTVSVWDLEKAEDDFKNNGQEAPWEAEQSDRMQGLSKDDLLL